MGFNRREDRIDFGVLGRFKHGDASSCGRKRRVGIREQARPKHEPPAGPLHAGTFGPNELDNTFGPEVKFIKAPMPWQRIGGFPERNHHIAVLLSVHLWT